MDNKLVITKKAYSELVSILRELIDLIPKECNHYAVDSLKKLEDEVYTTNQEAWHNF